MILKLIFKFDGFRIESGMVENWSVSAKPETGLNKNLELFSNSDRIS